MRLLLVEDDLDLAALLMLTLRHAGHTVDATDRVAGVAARAHGVDAVITDGVLLDGTADDVLIALAADPRTAALPVVVCSVRPEAVQHPSVVLRLRKPIEVATLADEVAAAVSVGTRPPAPRTTQSVATADRQHGLQQLEHRALKVAELAAAVLCEEDVAGSRPHVVRAAHRAIGLAGALGEPDLARVAAQAEWILAAPGTLSMDAAGRLCELAAELERGARERIGTAAQRAGPLRRGGPGGGLVVVVDDDEVLTGLVRRRLQAAGLEVIVYGHGREALDALLAEERHVDVIVLDIDLPGLNGLSVLRGLEQAGLLVHSRVVLATVHNNEAELAAALASRHVRHVPKPYELDRLVGVVLDEVTV